MGKNNYPENKYRKWFSTAITYLITGGLCWYMLWASAISHYTVLQNTVPEWTTYFCTGITTGSLSFIYAFYIRTFNSWSYIECDYNRWRRHSACGGLSPEQFENHNLA